MCLAVQFVCSKSCVAGLSELETAVVKATYPDGDKPKPKWVECSSHISKSAVFSSFHVPFPPLYCRFVERAGNGASLRPDSVLQEAS
jgi:hypothetical protein